MATINRRILLETIIRHETLTLEDIGKGENLGFVPVAEHLNHLLKELKKEGFVTTLNGVEPVTYTITPSGIAEGIRMKNCDSEQFLVI